MLITIRIFNHVLDQLSSIVELHRAEAESSIGVIRLMKYPPA